MKENMGSVIEILKSSCRDSTIVSSRSAASPHTFFVLGLDSDIIFAGNKSHVLTHWLDDACNDSFVMGEIKNSVFKLREALRGISSPEEVNRTPGKGTSGAPILFTLWLKTWRPTRRGNWQGDIAEVDHQPERMDWFISLHALRKWPLVAFCY